MRSPELGQYREQEPRRENDPHSALREATFAWTERLRAELKKKNLPADLRLSSAFLPSVLVSTMMACSPGTIVECTNTDRRYIQSTTRWAQEHPKELQAHFNKLWGQSDVNAQKLVNTLANAEIHCAIDANNNIESTNDIFYTAAHKGGEIYLFVDEEIYEEHRDLYEQGEWTAELDTEELGNLFHERTLELNELDAYAMALLYAAETLIHEAAHAILGSHDKKTRQKTAEIAEGKRNEEQLDTLDPIYSWGTAAREAVIDFNQQRLEEVIEYAADGE